MPQAYVSFSYQDYHLSDLINGCGSHTRLWLAMRWDESVLVSSQVIAKSAKLLPVMAMGRLLGDKHYSVSPAPRQGQPPGFMVHGVGFGVGGSALGYSPQPRDWGGGQLWTQSAGNPSMTLASRARWPQASQYALALVIAIGVHPASLTTYRDWR